MEKKRSIGFVGLGLMGSGMVKNLLSAGFPVIGYDMDESKMDALVGEGFQKADSPEGIPSLAETIILSLPNSHVVNGVIEGSLKLFETGRKGLILIDTTTADPVLSEEMAARLKERGIEMLDAAISGTSKMCAERKVTLLVGGSEEACKGCAPVFSALGKRTFHMGKNGAGAVAKLVVNLVLGLNRMVLAEGLCLAKKAGMDPHRTLAVLKESAAYSSAMDQKGLKMVEKEFLPAEGKLAFHLKDVRLMLDLGHRVNAPLLLSALHAQALRSEVAKGRGEWDNADIISFYEDLANAQS
ncbi:MAG: NAD(P)-dependent oxidoreductase [Proteobacteria bacterium]|nr:NAD(P)-dependent oxidoreductase [Pseudomonadota bacterium]